MFAVLGDILGSIGWGILISVLLLVLICVLNKSFNGRTSFFLLNVFLLIVGFFFFLFQSTLLVGGIKAKGYINNVETLLQAFSSEISYASLDEQQMQEAVRLLASEYPILETYAEDVSEEISGYLAETDVPLNFVEVIGYSLRAVINMYIFRRIGWLVFGFLLLTIGVIYAGSKNTVRTSTRSTSRKRYGEDYY